MCQHRQQQQHHNSNVILSFIVTAQSKEMEAQAALLQRMNTAVQNAHKAMTILKKENDKLIRENEKLKEEVSSLKKEMAELRRQAKSSSSRVSLHSNSASSSSGGEPVASRTNPKSQKSKSIEFVVPIATTAPTEDIYPIQTLDDENIQHSNQMMYEENTVSADSLMKSVMLITESLEPRINYTPSSSTSVSNVPGPLEKHSEMDSNKIILSVLGKRLGMKILKSSSISKWQQISTSKIRKLRLLFSQLSSDNYHQIAEELLKHGFQREEITNGFIHIVNRFFANNFEHIFSYSTFEKLLSHNSYYLNVMLAFLQELYTIGTSVSLSFLEGILHRLKNLMIGRLLLQESQEPFHDVLLGRPSPNISSAKINADNSNHNSHYISYIHHILHLKIKHIHSPNIVIDDCANTSDVESVDGVNDSANAITQENFYFDLSEEDEEEEERDKGHDSNNNLLIIEAPKDVSYPTIPNHGNDGTITSVSVPTWIMTTEQFDSDDEEVQQNQSQSILHSASNSDEQENERKSKLMQYIDDIMGGSSSEGEEDYEDVNNNSNIINDTTAITIGHILPPGTNSSYRKAIDDLSTATISEMLLKKESQESLLWLLYLETCCSLEMYSLLLDALQAWWMTITMFYPIDIYVVLYIFRKYGCLWCDEGCSPETDVRKLQQLMHTIMTELKNRLPYFVVQLEKLLLDTNYADTDFHDVMTVLLDLLQSCQNILSNINDKMPLSQYNDTGNGEYDILQTGLWQGLIQSNILSQNKQNNGNCVMLNGMLPGMQTLGSIYYMYQHLAQHASAYTMASYSIPDACIMSSEAHVGDLLVTPINQFESFCEQHFQKQQNCFFDAPRLHRVYIEHQATMFDEQFFVSTKVPMLASMQQSVEDVRKVLIYPFTRVLFDEQDQFFRIGGRTGFPASYYIKTKNLIQNLQKKIEVFTNHLRRSDSSGMNMVPSLNSLDLLEHSTPLTFQIKQNHQQLLPFYSTGQAVGILSFLSRDTIITMSQLLAYCDKILFHPIHMDSNRLDASGRDHYEKIRLLYCQCMSIFGMIIWERLLQGCLLNWWGFVKAARKKLDMWNITENAADIDVFLAWCELTFSIVNVIWYDVPHPWGGKHIAEYSYEITLVVLVCLKKLDACACKIVNNDSQNANKATILYRRFLSLQSSLLHSQQSLFPCFLIWPTSMVHKKDQQLYHNANEYVNVAIAKDEILRRQHCKAVGNGLRLNVIRSPPLMESSDNIDYYAAIPTTWDNRLRARFFHRMPIAKKPLTEEERQETWSHWCIWHHIAKLYDSSHELPQGFEAQGTYSTTAFTFDPTFYSQFQTTHFQRSFFTNDPTTINNNKISKSMFYIVLGATAQMKQGIDLTATVINAVRQLPSDWDILFLGGYCPKNNALYQEGSIRYTSNGEKIGCYKINYIIDGVAYVLRDSAAMKLVAENTPLAAPVYDHLAMMLYYEELQGFALTDPVVFTDIKKYVSHTADPVKKKSRIS